MERKSFLFLAIACIFILSGLLITYYPKFTDIIRVPEYYQTIQEAINAANSGDTISVASGTYKERIFINKSLTLIGENGNTIIDGNRETGPVISIINANNVNITGFIVRNSHREAYGIYIQNSSNSTICENIVTENNRGIFITNCINILVANNTITNDLSIGMYIIDSINVTLKDNKFIENKYNLGVSGKSLSHFIHYIDASNLINGKPICYLVNESNKIVAGDLGYVGAINCVNITVENMILSNNSQGILFAYTKNSIIRNVMATNNMGGILLVNSTNNIVVNNTITYNRLFGISLCLYSSNNTVSNNLILKNKSIVFKETTDGIKLEYATANRIVGNIISENFNGISILLSSMNYLYHNNFINNTLHEHSELSINSWDNGNKGNYWSGYVGEDVNEDGVGDTPYIIDENNKDNYPLMTPYIFP